MPRYDYAFPFRIDPASGQAARTSYAALPIALKGRKTRLDVRVFGQAGEAYSTLEGVQTSSLQASGGQANYWDYTTVEEASVRTIGNSAEIPYRGVSLIAVVKSGSTRASMQADFHRLCIRAIQ